MRKIQALVLSPMDSSYRNIQDAIERTLTGLGVTPVQIDEAFKPGARWDNAVTDAIQEADFIVADVSRETSNVLYELGFAHALRKPTLLMLSTDADSKMPSELVGYQIATYDPDDLGALENQISRFIKYQESRWSEKHA